MILRLPRIVLVGFDRKLSQLFVSILHHKEEALLMIGGPVGALSLRLEGLDGKVPDQVWLLVAVDLSQLRNIEVESDIQGLILDIGGVLVAQII